MLGVHRRLQSSLRLNFYFYVVISLVGLVAMVFLLVARELTLETLPSFVIALSNAFGLIAITAALAYGLVEVLSEPVSSWEQNELCCRAGTHIAHSKLCKHLDHTPCRCRGRFIGGLCQRFG